MNVVELQVNKRSYRVDSVPSEASLKEVILEKVHSGEREDREDPFYVVDLGRVLELHRDWWAALPSIHPFYAVKCNDDPLLLRTLAALGTGFDCASKGEMKAILDLGVSPDRIIYANPCKQTSHLKFAARHKVHLMTFDNELELQKVKVHFPLASLVLRIRADDPSALCQLGVKFGTSVEEGKRLLGVAKRLGLSVVGVSFHVGSGCQTPDAYRMAVEMACEVFRHAEAVVGYHLTLLDIGGGFPGTKGSGSLFKEVTRTINKSIEHHFSSWKDLQVIAEPGRYFACSTHTLAVNVISKRAVANRSEATDGGGGGGKVKEIGGGGGGDSNGGPWSFMYYVNDGVYGSFNCILFDHVTPTVSVLEEPCSTDRSGSATGTLYSSSVWGPTCDGLDKICDAVLPELSVGEWLYFAEMGAYTVSASSSFNGFLRPKAYYFVRESLRTAFQQLHSSIGLQQMVCLEFEVQGNKMAANQIEPLQAEQQFVIAALPPSPSPSPPLPMMPGLTPEIFQTDLEVC